LLQKGFKTIKTLKKYTAKPLGMVVAWGEPFAIAIANAITIAIPNSKTNTIFAYLDKDCERCYN